MWWWKKCCTAESRVSFCFVETSSTSLRSHKEFQGNFKDGWTTVVVVVVVWAYFDATPLWHPFATCPPQEVGTIGEQNQGSEKNPWWFNGISVIQWDLMVLQWWFNEIFHYIALGWLTYMSAEPDKGLGLDGFDSSRIRDKLWENPLKSNGWSSCHSLIPSPY